MMTDKFNRLMLTTNQLILISHN